jgi:hypothetical protein
MGHPWRPSPQHLAVALVLAVVGICLLLFLWLTAPADPAPAPPPTFANATVHRPLDQPAVRTDAQPDQQPASRLPEGDADPSPDLKDYVARGEKPSMGEVIERLHERGIRSGLGAFSPPGTRPPLVGLAVPEDFPLPAGYVRHHQVTDDGQTIEAVLMFAPDFQMVDAAGKPVAMPKDRVVPPELAPPGLPIRRIVIPAPLDPATPGR